MGPAAPIAYAYIYDTSGATVAPNTNISFNADGPTSVGISHTPGSSQIVLVAAGTYKVSFSVSADVINEISVFVNGAAIPGSIFSSGGSLRANVGQIIMVAAGGDILTIRNLHPGAGIVLDNSEDGSTLTDASVLIERLG
jgi:BclA C-terminal domain